jgi:hypothetical protein
MMFEIYQIIIRWKNCRDRISLKLQVILEISHHLALANPSARVKHLGVKQANIAILRHKLQHRQSKNSAVQTKA